MSAGITALSDADLLKQIGSAGLAKPPAATELSGMSDADLLQQIKAAAPVKAATFDERFGSGPTARTVDEADPLYAGLRGKADEMLVGKPSAANRAAAAVIPAANAAAFNIPRAVGAVAASLPGVGNGRSYGENYDLAKDQEEALARQYPKTALAGTVAGIGAGALALPGFQAAKGAGLAARATAAAGTGAVYGAAGGLLDASDAGEVGKHALIGGAAGAVLAPVAEKAFDVGGKAFEALKPFFAKGVSTRNSAGQFTDEARAMLTRAGVNPDTIDHKTERALLGAFEKGGVTDAALNEGRAAAQGISLTKGQATGDYAQQQAEALAARNGQNAGQKDLAEIFNKQQEQIATRQKEIGEGLAGGESRVNSPYEAGEMVATRARAVADDAAYRSSEGEGLADAALTNLRGRNDPLAVSDAVAARARGVVDEAARAEQAAQGAGDAALATARGAGDAIDSAGIVAGGVRNRAAAARDRYQRGYEEVANTEGTFQPGSLDRMGSSIQNRLGTEFPIDPVVTPAASRALTDLDNLRVTALNANGTLSQRAVGAIRQAGLNPAEVEAALTARGTTEANARSLFDELRVDLPRGLIGRFDPTGPNLREMDQVRKRLVSYYKSTGQNPEDRRAMREILSQFDDHAERAMDAGLFSGDPSALGRLREARGQFRDYQQTFRPQGAGDDVGAAMRRIVERDARPDEVAGLLYGNVQSGNVGRPLRLADRLQQTLGADSPEFLALRRGLVSEIANGRNMAPEAVSARIEQALTGDGRQLTQRLLTPEQVNGLRTYQRAVAQAEQARASVPAWATDLAANGFEPQRVAERLYGTAATGRASSSQYADGLRTFFGANSPEWQAIQQGYVSHVLGGADMAPDAIGKRIAAALSPENRLFAQRLLSPEQVKGLEAVQRGLNTAKVTRESVPEWVADLTKGDFDPRRVVERMLGTTAPGSSAAAAQYTSGLKNFLGKDSPEWAAIRQAAWQQLVNKPEGFVGDYGAQAQANRIAEFLERKGKTLASVLYSPQELAQMREYASVLKLLVPQRLAGGSASPNSDTAPASAAMLRRLSAKGNHIASTLGAAGLATGGIGRAVLGWGFGKGVAKVADRVQDRAERRFAQEAVLGAPRAALPKPLPVTVGNAPAAIAGSLALQ